VIRVDMPSFGPTEIRHRRFGRREHRSRFGPDKCVLPIGFVPDRHDLHPVRQHELAGTELGLRLMSKSITDTDGVFFES